MSRRPTDPLRPLTEEERAVLSQISRAASEPASHLARAKALLAVANGYSYTAAAQVAGCRLGDTVATWVARFNQEGLAALAPRHGGGATPSYGPAERARILREFHRSPDREQDGTATWSLSTLRRALRRAPDGLPRVSTLTIWWVLHEAGLTWQRTRTWCPTGSAVRKRKSGPTTVSDPDTAPKKT
jgi:transposase